ncbi:MAG: PH domain-containing protein [Erysipelotrichaceae bacterium]|nr:PH domain-containing protein [Erysipelotrichaceae bacterium]
MVFKGKVALWYYMVFFVYNTLPIKGLINQTPDTFTGIAMIIYYLGNLIIVPPMIRNKVEIRERDLILYFGFSVQVFKIDEIINIHRSHCILASSACSLDRIYVEFKKQEMYIALKENQKFIDQILKMRPTLRKY